MKRTLSGLMSVMFLVAAFCLFNVGTVSAATTIIKFQSCFPKTSRAGMNFSIFAEKVAEYTNGEVVVKVYWPGQLVNPKEAFSALQRGMIEAFGGSSMYYVGVMPEFNFELLPYLCENPEEAAEIMLNYGVLDLMRKAAAKHGIRYIAPLSTATMNFLTSFPIHTLEDLKGKKIRAPGMLGEIAAALGATPVNLTTAEQYVALQRGTVDGTMYPIYTLEDYKFYEVVQYVSMPGYNSPGWFPILMNASVYDKMSPANKVAIDRAGIEMMWISLLYGEIKDKRAKKFSEEKGVKIIELAPEEVKRFRKATLPVYESHAEKSDLCARQVEIIKKYWKDKGR
ncbi:MAG: TRAP transporter substrate-binding protein [Deltaproteobacteria bacterium]|nr:TRAP transporter substrate-binding protein [Deltaproteobacteria bacterium]